MEWWSEYHNYLVGAYLHIVILPELTEHTAIPKVLEPLIDHYFEDKNKEIKENSESGVLYINTTFGRCFTVPYDPQLTARQLAEYLQKNFGIPVAAQTLVFFKQMYLDLDNQMTLHDYNINDGSNIRLQLNSSLMPDDFRWPRVFPGVLTIQLTTSQASKFKLSFDYHQFCKKYETELPTIKQFKDEIFEKYHINQKEQILFYDENKRIDDEDKPLEYYFKLDKSTLDTIHLFYSTDDSYIPLQIDYQIDKKFVVLNVNNDPLYNVLLPFRYNLFKEHIIDNTLLCKSDIARNPHSIELRVGDMVLNPCKTCSYYQNILQSKTNIETTIKLYRNYFIYLKVRVMCYFDPNPLQLKIRERCTIKDLKQMIIEHCDGLIEHCDVTDLDIFYIENHSEIQPGYIYQYILNNSYEAYRNRSILSDETNFENNATILCTIKLNAKINVKNHDKSEMNVSVHSTH
eukprot:105213_1